MRSLRNILSVLAAVSMLMPLAACKQDENKSSQSTQESTASVTESLQESGTMGEASENSTEESGFESTAPQSSTQVSASERTEPQSSPEESSNENSSQASNTEVSSYGLESFSHPDYIVGKWSLKLETSELEGEKLDEAKQRMLDTSMVLNSDGTAVGIYNESRIKGYWGAQSNYIYVSLGGDDPEVFSYYIDTLVSINYQGMSFVK